MSVETTAEPRQKRTYKQTPRKSFLQAELPRPRTAFVPEVAEAIGVSGLTIQNWIKSGKLKATKIGHQWRIPVTEVERLIRELEGAA